MTDEIVFKLLCRNEDLAAALRHLIDAAKPVAVYTKSAQRQDKLRLRNALDEAEKLLEEKP